MNDLKKKMIRRAKKQFKHIHPCSAKSTLGECFTVEEDQMLFWFNTPDEDTHVLTQDLT